MSLCFECGEPAVLEHHVVPFSVGGTKTVPLCAVCHKKVHSPESTISLGALCRRSPRGPHKIRESQTREIIAMRNSGALLKDIATRFNISLVHASFVARGKTRISKKLLST